MGGKYMTWPWFTYRVLLYIPADLLSIYYIKLSFAQSDLLKNHILQGRKKYDICAFVYTIVLLIATLFLVFSKFQRVNQVTAQPTNGFFNFAIHMVYYYVGIPYTVSILLSLTYQIKYGIPFLSRKKQDAQTDSQPEQDLSDEPQFIPVTQDANSNSLD